jgi:sulfide:quinone oxidoreductase
LSPISLASTASNYSFRRWSFCKLKKLLDEHGAITVPRTRLPKRRYSAAKSRQIDRETFPRARFFIHREIFRSTPSDKRAEMQWTCVESFGISVALVGLENGCAAQQEAKKMARILIVGGGFAGLVTAEKLASSLGVEHEISLVSPDRLFTFYPALVNLAFGKCGLNDIQFDLASKLKELGVHYIEGSMTRLISERKAVEIAGKDMHGELSYDYVVFALGRRLATEKVSGFYKHSHHLLDPKAAMKFGEAVDRFKGGDIVLGACPGARLPVPVCEAAFEIARRFEKEIESGDVRVKVIFPESLDEAFGGAGVHQKFEEAFARHKINVIYNVPITAVTENEVLSSEGHKIHHDLLMLVPPFKGHSALSHYGFTDEDEFVLVDGTMRVFHHEHMYAIGDDVAFSGPKFAHMAVRQAEVAAENIVAEISGIEPSQTYYHEIAAIVDAGGTDSIYVHYGIWDEELYRLKRGRFWGIAKAAHDTLWQADHR